METEARLLLTYHTLPAAFCELVVPSLEQSEEKYALPLGLCMRILPARQADLHKLLLASVRSPEGNCASSALRSAPHYLLVQSEPLCELALELLAKSLAERGAVLPGVTGVMDASDCFARCWQVATGAAAELETCQRAYALREVNPVRKPVGTKKRALPEHAPLILEWINAMSVETALGNQAAWTLEDVSACIQDGVFYLWCAGSEPAAMAFYNRHAAFCCHKRRLYRARKTRTGLCHRAGRRDVRAGFG